MVGGDAAELLLNEEHVTLLISMGFLDESEVRQALRLAKNDINDAIAYLTHETPGLGEPTSSYDGIPGPIQAPATNHSGDDRSSMRSGSEASGSTITNNQAGSPNSGRDSPPEDPMDSMEFPTTHLYDLEQRVFCNSWNVPFGRRESLGRCLYAATRLAKEKLAESDDGCRRFFDRCFPDCFHKLIESQECNRWGGEIQSGIVDMCEMLIDLVVARLEYMPVSQVTMNALATIFNPDSTFQQKNRLKGWSPQRWEKEFGLDKSYGVPSKSDGDPHGVLVDLINRFAHKKGFELIGTLFKTEILNPGDFYHLLYPFSNAGDFLNQDVLLPIIQPWLIKAVKYVQEMSDADLKQQSAGWVFDLLTAVNKLRQGLWAPEPTLESINALRLSFILRLLKSAHFGSRMLALRDVSKLLDALTDPKPDPLIIPAVTISQWLTKNKVLTLALEGNIDQAQYCDRLKTLLAFLGSRLTPDEISKIWSLRKGRAAVAVDNVYHIVAQAASKFGQNELDHLMTLIEKSWETEEERGKERIIRLLGTIGTETSNAYTMEKTAGVLWKLAHHKNLHKDLVIDALSQQLEVINRSPGDEMRKEYIFETLKNLKDEKLVLQNVWHLSSLISSVRGSQGSSSALWTASYGYATALDRKKRILEELVSKHNLIEIVLSCLSGAKKDAISRAVQDTPRSSTPIDTNIPNDDVTFNQSSRLPQPPPVVVPQTLLLMPSGVVAASGGKALEPTFGPDLVLSDGNSYGTHVDSFLKFLVFVVKDGGHPLSWSKTKELWSIFMENSQCCLYDRNVCFHWLMQSCDDLQDDCKCKLLQEKLLKLDSTKLNVDGFRCFRKFFELVNKQKGKLKQPSWNKNIEVDQMDLIGLDFVWEVSLNCLDMEIVTEAVNMLIELSYTALSSKQKRDASSVHKRFLDECSRRLESTLLTLRGSMVGRVLSDAARILTGVSVPKMATLPPSSREHQKRSIERLLFIVSRYVWTVEEDFCSQRFMPAHGTMFFGKMFRLTVVSEVENYKKTWNLLVHEHETLRSVRERVAVRVGLADEMNKVELSISGTEFEVAKDQQTLKTLGRVPNSRGKGADHPDSAVFMTVKKKFIGAYVANYDPVRRTSEIRQSNSESNLSSKQLKSLEEEKSLPSVMMSISSQVFDLLYELATLEDSSIGRRVRDLILLISSDPSVTSLLDELGRPATAPPKTNSLERKLKNAASLVTDGMKEKSPKLKLKGHSRNASETSIGATGSSTGGEFRTYQQHQEEKLQKILDVSQPGMSPFRLIYNLEILSARLIPTSYDEQSLKNAAQFKRDFVNASGLKFLIGILKRDALPVSCIPECRMMIYERLLQLLSYLLCNESELHKIVECETEEEKSSQRCPASPTRVPSAAALSTSPGAAAASAGDGHMPFSFRDLELPRSLMAEDVSKEEFKDILERLQRIVWAAAGGFLHILGQCDLKSPAQNSGPSGFYIGSPRGRISESSTGSSDGSSCACADPPSSVHTGLMNANSTPSESEEQLVETALELMVSCTLLRKKNMLEFFEIPHFGDFVLDLILLCSSEKVRQCMEEQLMRIGYNSTPWRPGEYELPEKSQETPDENSLTRPSHPQYTLLQILMKAHLPLWTSSSSARGWSRRLLAQCSEYFSLRSRLISALSAEWLAKLQPNATQMLEDETQWILNFNCSTDPRMVETDSRLLAGHMQLISTLLKQAPEKKEAMGEMLIGPLVNELLFPASRLVGSGGTVDRNSARHARASDQRAKLNSVKARNAAYELMLELCRNCSQNFYTVTELMTGLHHQDTPELTSQWDYMPLVERKMTAGYVGLKNAGATCYMNAVLQHFFLEPGLVEEILSIDLEGDENEEGSTKNSIFYEMQRLFSHLKEAEYQYYTPKQFWDVFRLGGEKVNPREQQDALEFYVGLIDQVDGELKRQNREEIFKRKYQGVFSDQKICHGCPHRYEREEAFYALNLPLRAHGLEESLNQFVKGEILEGDNAYVCEKCAKKRNTVKRTCVKTLPPVLVIQLKRFDYDWEENRALKFNEHFQFPRSLDMYPYTASAMTRNDSVEDLFEISGASNLDTPSSTPIGTPYGGHQFLSSSPVKTGLTSPLATSPLNTSRRKSSFLDRFSRQTDQGGARYDLTGVVVHSGQASAGHYYAFIKERRDETVLNGNYGKWYKFNDTTVEEVEMTDEFMETELFGGKYTVKQEKHSTFPEERERYWNAYLLFYQRSSHGNAPLIRTPRSANNSSKRSISMSVPTDVNAKASKRRDSLVELTALVEQGERQQIFRDWGSIPFQIKEEIKEENFLFARNRDIFNVEYFNFIAQLVDNVAFGEIVSNQDELDLKTVQFGMMYLLNLCWHTKKALRQDPEKWVCRLNVLFERCPISVRWLLGFFGESPGSNYLKSFLFDSDSGDVRQGFGNLIARAMTAVNSRARPVLSTNEAVSLLEELLRLVGKEAVDQWQKSSAYFSVLLNYASFGTYACEFLLEKSAFGALLNFMVHMPEESHLCESRGTVFTMSRRWSLSQARDFGAVYNILALMIMSCDLKAFWSTGISAERLSSGIIGQPIGCPPEIEQVVFGPMSSAFISELLFALNNVYNTQIYLVPLVRHCATNNEQFSQNLLVVALENLSKHSSKELGRILGMIGEVLNLDDCLQSRRIEIFLDGIQNSTKPAPLLASTKDSGGMTVSGILDIIIDAHKPDSRRSYNCVKFLVTAAEKIDILKDALNQRLERWQWCVDWLKEKMEVGATTRSGIALGTGFNNQQTSNEESHSKAFQRTVSAQYTLDSATALLTEFSAQSSPDEREENGDSENRENSSRMTEDSGSTLAEDISPDVSGGSTATLQKMEEGNLSPRENVQSTVDNAEEQFIVEIECSSEEGSNQGQGLSGSGSSTFTTSTTMSQGNLRSTPKKTGNSQFYVNTP